MTDELDSQADVKLKGLKLIEPTFVIHRATVPISLPKPLFSSGVKHAAYAVGLAVAAWSALVGTVILVSVVSVLGTAAGVAASRKVFDVDLAPRP